MTNSKDHRQNQYNYSSIENAKTVDQWLLVSEKHSRSTSHMDVEFATWVSCLSKKIFWVWNQLYKNQQI